MLGRSAGAKLRCGNAALFMELCWAALTSVVFSVRTEMLVALPYYDAICLQEQTNINVNEKVQRCFLAAGQGNRKSGCAMKCRVSQTYRLAYFDGPSVKAVSFLAVCCSFIDSLERWV